MFFHKWWRITENFLGNLPRVVLLALAVVFMRNPIVGRYSDMGWYLRLPLEFVLLLLVTLAVAAALRVAVNHGNEGPDDEKPAPSEGKPLA